MKKFILCTLILLTPTTVMLPTATTPERTERAILIQDLTTTNPALAELRRDNAKLRTEAKTTRICCGIIGLFNVYMIYLYLRQQQCADKF